MKKVFTDMLELARPLLAPSGGPIILGQVENEFRWTDPAYVQWCGDLVKDASPGVPFLMCNGYSASNTINTFNGNDGSEYAESHGAEFPGQPLAWTEDEGWFQEWDRQPLAGRDDRTPQDMAHVVMKWFARGAAHHNYYMWYGGNNFGRLAGSCVTNMYSDGVNLHSDMLANEPKKTHLSKLHDLLGSYSDSLLHSPSQVNNATKVLVYNETVHKFVEAKYQFAYVYSASGRGVAFVENSVNETAVVQFRGANVTLPGLSSSLLDLATPSPSELYNSAEVHSQGLPTRRTYATVSGGFPWRVWGEEVGRLAGGFTTGRPLEQLSVTQDLSDYLFYQTSVLGTSTGRVNLTVESRVANSFLAFVDGELQSVGGYCTHNQGDRNYTLGVETAAAKVHQLTLLSVSLGVNTHTVPGQFDLKGITGDVTLSGKNITAGKWLHRAKLSGEIMHVYSVNGSSNVSWTGNYSRYTGRPLVWYRHTFPSPAAEPRSSLLLDLAGMGRGYLYLNGASLGRYWLTQVAGQYVQRYYYLPPSLLLDTGNLLVLGEEIGAVAPETVRLVRSTFVVP
jgi:beta-galactosidase